MIQVPLFIDDEMFDADILNDSEHEYHDDQVSTLKSICQGGCASGSYMPAVTYHTARETMNEHGDDVLDYIEDIYGELPAPPEGCSWSGMACYFLSLAVESWAIGAMQQIDPNY